MENNIQSNGYITVGEANEQVRAALDTYIGFIKIKGEIASITFHSSGHIYFSLKDDKAQIDGVIFKNIIKPEFKLLKVGDFVYALGTITSYIKTGRMSFQTYYISVGGQGNIHYDLSALKEKLDKEGVFLPQKALSLPTLLQKLVVITSLTGAALKDFLSLIQGQTLGNTEIIIIEALMQGEQTSSSIIQALEVAQKLEDIQAILITRGGGSYEDLWGFNNEQLCRFISTYPIPIISAIGHEQDYTLLDFTAHTRFATPSAAAYGLFFYKQVVENRLLRYIEILNQNLSHTVERIGAYLHYAKEQLNQNLLYKLAQKQMQLDYLHKSLLQANPKILLKKGYVIVLEHNQKSFEAQKTLQLGDTLTLMTQNGKVNVQVI